MAKKKLSKDIIFMSGASLAVSVATMRVLYAPKRKVEVGSFKIPVGGVLALSQDTVAEISKTALNNALPWYANKMNRLFVKFKIKENVKNYVIKFVYEYLGKYSLNTVIDFIVKKVGKVDEDTYKNAVSAFIQKYITEKADRDALITAITDEVVHTLRVLTEGTLAALVFNDKFASALSSTLAAAVDRFIQNEAATKLTDFLFSIAGKLDNITIPNLLKNTLGLGPDEMAQYIDMIYDLLLGDKMVEAFTNAKYGDAVYETIKSIDFDKLDHVLTHEMKKDVYKLNLTAMSSAVSFYQSASKTAFSVAKKVKSFNDTKNKIKNKFGKKKKS